ncbi:MAG: CHAD domain-containing protein [Calditrichota bacterium]
MKASEPGMSLLFDPAYEPSAILENLEFTTEREEQTTLSYQLFDTPDGRLQRKGMFLLFQNGSLSLKTIVDSQVIASLQIAEMVRFSDDLPKSSLKKNLKRICSMRALLPFVKGVLVTTHYRLRDVREKMIARLELTSCFVQQGRQKKKVAAHVQLNSLRGYAGETTEVGEMLKQSEMPLLDRPLAELLLNSYATETVLRSETAQLNAEMSSFEAMNELLMVNARAMRQNIDGICRQIDTEFLHDFRVAIRRTRAALTQLKGILPEKDTEHYRAVFSRLGKRTNRLRDLDVYLLGQEEMTQELLPAIRQDTAPLFETLDEERLIEQKRTTRYLRSKAFQELLTDWETYLQDPPGVLPIESSDNIVPLAKRRIWFYYERLIKRGRKIHPSSPDETLHKLRLDAKKLRYLLEFFQNLFPPTEMRAFISELKKLQNNLGDFQDGSVQIDELLKYGREVGGSAIRTRKALLASGSLLGQIHARKKVLRKDFDEIFERFSRSSVRERMKNLCKP